MQCVFAKQFDIIFLCAKLFLDKLAFDCDILHIFAMYNLSLNKRFLD